MPLLPTSIHTLGVSSFIILIGLSVWDLSKVGQSLTLRCRSLRCRISWIRQHVVILHTYSAGSTLAASLKGDVTVLKPKSKLSKLLSFADTV